MLLVVAERLLIPQVLPVGRWGAVCRHEILLEILLEPSPHLGRDPGVSTVVLTGFPRDPTPIVIAIDGTDTHLNAQHDRRAVRRIRV